ncbi:hypothetical protein Q428_01240 [Fervidicella metallireducens AeB]|uniref:UPF0473 protein Q428_01240 n=2 Tax=Fervidicella TaxID=1403538 RepID=A0A017RYC3_9CLOT|nr:DUF1292 domain-containing protein [Fervidicella metallireducens]EYE89667.1 hypothetical protein Q428_01240 [Fervidicella metallireducens AeB]
MENMENVVVLTDENGVETKFEVITALEVDGKEYFVLYPVDSEEDDAVVFRLDTNEDGEEMLAEIEDDEEFEKVAQAYEEWLEAEDDEE